MNITRYLRKILQSRCELRLTNGLRTSGRPNPFNSQEDAVPQSKPHAARFPAHQNVDTISTTLIPVITSPSPPTASEPLDIDWSQEMHQIRADESRSILQPAADHFDATTATPNTRPAHNLAAYVKKSPTLQRLIELGVDLHSIERRNGLAEFVLRLDFERDIQPHLRFLSDVGLAGDQLGAFVSRNPLIFKEDLETLTTRINYLQSKRFAATDIGRIVRTNPHWLMFSTQRIDGRLGFFQRQFELSGSEMRQLVVRNARLVTYGLEAVRRSSFVMREEFGFDAAEVKRLLLSAPKLWMMNPHSLTERFEYVHKTMGISLERIADAPDILYCRKHRLHERHSYLVLGAKAQYDPRLPLYVSFQQLVAGSDGEFALNVARTTPDAYEAYLRTL